MTLNDIKQLFAYNTWANKKFFDAISQITTEQYNQEFNSSHGGLRGTLTHLIAAEKMWLSRWRNTPDKALLRPEEIPTLAELRSLCESVEKGIDALLDEMAEEKLHQTMTMTTIKGDTYVHSYAHMMQHLVNHSSYHRGQLACILRQLGIKPPATDLIAFFRHTS